MEIQTENNIILILNLVLENELSRESSIRIFDDLRDVSGLTSIEKIGFDERKKIDFTHASIEKLWISPQSLTFEGITYADYKSLFFSRRRNLKISGMIKFPVRRSDGTTVPGFMNAKFIGNKEKVNLVSWDEIFTACIKRLAPSFAILFPFRPNEDVTCVQSYNSLQFGVWAWQLASRKLPDIGWLTYWGKPYDGLLLPALKESDRYDDGIIKVSDSVDEYLMNGRSEAEKIKSQISIDFGI